MTRFSRFGWAAAVTWLATSAAGAQLFSENPLIQQGIDLYNDLEYEASIDTLQRALIRAENAPEQKVAIFKYLALDYLVLQRSEDAEQSFRQLLAIEPEFALDGTFSPEYRQILEGVREAWEREGRPGWVRPETRLPPVALDHEPPGQATRGEPLEVAVTAEDPASRTSRMVLAYRAAGGTEYTLVAAQPRGTSWSAVIPGDSIEPPVIEYYFQALDAQNNILANSGDQRVPMRVPVPDGDDGSILSEWWFWTVIGVGVAAAIAVPVGVVYGSETGGGSDPATVTITLCDPLVDCP